MSAIFTRFNSVLACAFIVSASALAEEQVATVARVFGDVKILTNPSKAIEGSQPHALYEGMYYRASKAKAGDKLLQGTLIQTGAAARARLIYDNGDQITVSSNSAYQVQWDPSKRESKPVIDVLMGSIRSQIQKGGPRSGMSVRTRSAVMGVRGTDFYVSARGSDGNSEIAVIRGKVDVVPSHAEHANPIEVGAGFSAKIPEAPAKESKVAAAASEVKLQKTTKEEIAQIQQVSEVKKTVEDKESPELQKQLAALEHKATENTIADIKATNPDLLAKFSKEDLEKADIDSLQNAATNHLMKDAPSAPASVKFIKPSKRELDTDKDDNKKYYPE